MKTQPNQSWLQLRLFIRVLAILLFLATIIGAIMAWVFFFRPYDHTFSELKATELTLQQAVYNETTTRVLVDMALMQEQAAQEASLTLDISTRIEEQDAVNASLILDIIARETGDAEISSALEVEIAGRILNDTILQAEIVNATSALEAVQTFDVFSMQQFMIKMGNISDLSAEIDAEIAARIAADLALQAADLIIDEALVLLISQLSVEVANRISNDTFINNELHIITETLLETINGQLPIAHNMIFQSLSANLIIANGGPSNQITVTQTALGSLAGVTPDASENIAITATHGLTVLFPSANTIEIGFISTAPPTSSNHARLRTVVPYGKMTEWIQGQYGQNLKDGYVECTADVYCDACFLIGPTSYECINAVNIGWHCAAGFSTSMSGMRCVSTSCNVNGEAYCNNMIGNPWHCRNDNCVLDYCTSDNDCIDEHGTGWYCNNYACAQAQLNGVHPVWSVSYPSSSYETFSQPNHNPQGYTGEIWPQDGAKNGMRAYPHVYGNRLPYEPRGSYGNLYQECFFNNNWEGRACGFFMPARGGTYIVDITINVRVGLNQPGSLQPPMFWLYMHIDRAGQATPQWEMVDSDYVSINNLGPAPLSETYVTMTTTVIASTATPSSPYTSPMIPGTFVYAGFSGYWPSTDNGQFVSWYSITYDITQVA